MDLPLLLSDCIFKKPLEKAKLWRPKALEGLPGVGVRAGVTAEEKERTF